MITFISVFVSALCVAASAGSPGHRSFYPGSNIGPSVGPYPPLDIQQNQFPNRQVNQASSADFAQAGRFFANQGTSQIQDARLKQVGDEKFWRRQRAQEDSAIQWAENSLARDNKRSRYNDEVAATEIREEIGSLFDLNGTNERYGLSTTAEQAAATQIAVEVAAESAIVNQRAMQLGAQQTTVQSDQRAGFNEQVVKAEIREEIGSLFDIGEAKQYGSQRTAGQSATSQIAIELAAESAVANQRAMQVGAQQQSAVQAATWQQQQQVAAQAAARQQQQQVAWQQQQQVAAQTVAIHQQQQAAAQALARQQQQQVAWQQQQQAAAQAAMQQQQQQQQAAMQQQQRMAAQAAAQQRAYQQAQTTSTKAVAQSQSGPGIIGLVLPGQRSSAVSQTTSSNQARQKYYQPVNSIGQTRVEQNQYQNRLDQSQLGGSRVYQPRLDQQSASQASSSSVSSSNTGAGRSKIFVFESNTGSNQAPIVEIVSPGQFGPVVEVIDPENARNTGQNLGQQNRIAENILYQGIGVIDNFGL